MGPTAVGISDCSHHVNGCGAPAGEGLVARTVAIFSRGFGFHVLCILGHKRTDRSYLGGQPTLAKNVASSQACKRGALCADHIPVREGHDRAVGQ